MTKEEQGVRVLKSGTCPSLSGKSKLTYEIGCNEASELQARIAKNSGGGFYSDEWVPWAELLRVLSKPGNRAITSHSLIPLFKGKSVNTAGFLLAVLKHERLVQPIANAKRNYEVLDGSAFVAEIQALMSGTATKKPAGKARAPKK